ncbi:MAG: F0F1 ATP synthase subunit A, partial [Pseudomonadota bacterium]
LIKPIAVTVTKTVSASAPVTTKWLVTVTAIGFIKHGTHFLTFFVPQDAPTVMKPLLALIEVISYFVRPLSHSVRLAANMIAGHAILKVFAGFATALAIYGASVATIPVAFFSVLVMIFMFALEVLVAAVQAYIFAMLTSIYLNDALHMH